MRPDNGTLAQHPDMFEFVRSPAKTTAFAIITAVLLIVMVLCLINFDAVQEMGENYRGRRSRALAPYIGYIVVGLCAIFAIWAGMHAARTGTWRMRNGQRLKQRAWVVNADLDAVHQRLSTMDPRAYLPMPVSSRSDNARRRLRAYTPEGASVTFLTLTAGVGKNERHLPLITFEGAAHEAFHSVRTRLSKPFKG
ncbi:hypothetical protein [Occultella kanbiaonis]|uniref:hypothetical protein n=1 Tax=Occultella kanbiaonis TaxID=2675754 RepID=UPI0013CFE842|nr:hypothetical protein [Occultella kanbiaonis]